jgi:hypothetical protein
MSVVAAGKIEDEKNTRGTGGGRKAFEGELKSRGRLNKTGESRIKATDAG